MSPDRFDDVQGRWRMIHDTYNEGYKTGTAIGFVFGAFVSMALALIVWGIKIGCEGGFQ